MTASVHTLNMPKPSQTCDNVRLQRATEWTASVHSLHMSKPAIAFVEFVVSAQKEAL